MSLNIAHFIHRYPPALGGAESYFLRLSEYLARQGDRVTVFTTSALDLTAFWSPAGRCLPAGVAECNGVEIRRYALWRMAGRRWLLKPLSMVPHPLWQCLTLPCNPISLPLFREVHRSTRQFDIVHASAFPYAFPIACAWRLARRLEVPFVLTPFLHTGDPNDPRDPIRRAYTQKPLRFLLQQADVVLVQTPTERRSVQACGVPEEKIVLQGLGVTPEECTGGDRLRARAKWRIKEGEVVIGHLANLSHEKGSIDLARAAARLWQQGDSFRLVLAGPSMPGFDRFLRRFHEQDRLIITGPLDDLEKRDFYAGIDLFALPSRTDSFGLVLLEAWANGLATIAYRAGGVADVIRHGQDGLLVPCGDLAALAESLRVLIEDPVLRRRLGSNGKSRVREFSWDRSLELVRDLYQRLYDRRGRLPQNTPAMTITA